MSRINTNIQSLQAIHRLGRNTGDLNTRLERLASGLRINSGKDDPAGLIASETLRSEINGIRTAIDNTSRANNVINTAEGSLNEVSSLLLELQGLTLQAANSGALSDQEVQANQLQVDSILNSINRISNTTQFNGIKLLNGSLDYTLSGVTSTAIDIVTVNAAKLPDNGSQSIVVQVTGSAQLGEVQFTGTDVGTSAITVEVAGVFGTEQLSFAANTTTSAVATAVNSLKESTGVSAVVSGSALRFTSTGYGSDQFVSVKTISGVFVNGKDSGQDATVAINGSAADVRGLTATLRNGDLDIEVSLDAAFGTVVSNTGTSFNITGGGAKFQIGSQVNRPGQIQVGLGSVATTKLGNDVLGRLSTIGSDGDNSLVKGNFIQAQKILTESIRQVSVLRGRLGALQKNVLETNSNSLSVALENVTASESAIRDADFASETAALTRAQILVQANTSVLAQANAAPQQVLALLQ
ncbi:MAG TPA: flagellin [Tepidisphaeraceae bacterium]|nr:flagellin [Tepidisphaeraceae bacterium]